MKSDVGSLRFRIHGNLPGARSSCRRRLCARSSSAHEADYLDPVAGGQFPLLEKPLRDDVEVDLDRHTAPAESFRLQHGCHGGPLGELSLLAVDGYIDHGSHVLHCGAEGEDLRRTGGDGGGCVPEANDRIRSECFRLLEHPLGGESACLGDHVDVSLQLSSGDVPEALGEVATDVLGRVI